MIDLPDHGYVERKFINVDPGGTADGALGGPSEFVTRPGYRYGIQFTLASLTSRDDARIFETLLEQAQTTGDDVSYPWPLDIRSSPAGIPRINGSSPPGAVIPVRGLLSGFQFRVGQPMAVILADGTGFIHKAASAVSADGTGHATVPVLPLTRTTFADGLVIEVERPRIRGRVSWDGSTQPAYGKRPFTFTITERR